MEKKRIVHIIPTFELGGVQTGILYSLKDINIVFDYKILVIGKIDKAWLKSLPNELQQYIISSGSDNLAGGCFKGYFKLKELRPDFILTSLWKSVALSVCYKLLHKNVLLGGFFHSTNSPHLASTISMKALSFVQNTSFADSNVTKQFVEHFYKIKDTHVVPFYFTFKKVNGRNLFNASSIKMAHFGRISSEKGIDRAIEFCRLLKSRNLDFIFDLYGDGALALYEARIKKAGLQKEVHIKKTLPLSEVTSYMSKYDFLIQLSNHEGMALAVVEAMNCGLVPIVTPVGEISNYSKDGFNAIWLEANFDDNLQVLVGKLEKVVNNPDIYRDMSSAAAGTFLSYKKYSETLIEILNSYLT